MRFISASQVFSGIEFYKEPVVLVLNYQNQIEDVVPAHHIEASKVEQYEGILCPGFINTHCHLELSHLKNEIDQHTGIVDFALEVIKKRHNLSEGLQVDLMQEADRMMCEQGIVAIGDISNSNLSIQTKKNSTLYYHTFVELISLHPERAIPVFEAGKALALEFQNSRLEVSLAAHAPYSVSTKLIHLISEFGAENKTITSIHNQESKAENEFFKTRSGDFIRLYDTLNIPIEYFKATQKSSLQSVLSSINSSINTLLVHNTFSDLQDIQFAKEQHAHLYWCLCPNANLYIENSLPNLKELMQQNCTLTIGTDSLASNGNLSIIEEINSILNHQPDISLDILLKAATYNGACFLRKEQELGSFQKNTKPGINLIKKEKQSFIQRKIA